MNKLRFITSQDKNISVYYAIQFVVYRKINNSLITETVKNSFRENLSQDHFFSLAPKKSIVIFLLLLVYFS